MPPGAGRIGGSTAHAVGGVGRLLADLAGLPVAGLQGLLHSTMPFQAPRTVFNQGVTGARRFAGPRRGKKGGACAECRSMLPEFSMSSSFYPGNTTGILRHGFV